MLYLLDKEVNPEMKSTLQFYNINELQGPRYQNIPANFLSDWQWLR